MCCAAHAVADDFTRIDGRYVELVTDIESTSEAKSLAESFDAAVPQWIAAWGLAGDSASDWKVTACVMRDKTAFIAAGLIPPRVPDFPFGYALDDDVWVLAQPSEYYTRHLMLHEGVHALAYHCFGGGGPTWYMEGTAEWLATHRGVGDAIRVADIPGDKDDVPYWGRFKLLEQTRSQNEIPPIETVMNYSPTLTGDIRLYTFSWSAVSMFHAYPDTRESFLSAAKIGRDNGPNFNRGLYARLSTIWPTVAARWRIAMLDFDYGFDWSQNLVDIATTDPNWDGRSIELNVDARRGWQSIGVRVPGGATVRIAASGMIGLNGNGNGNGSESESENEKPWTSTASGVTIRYQRGRPLGQLIACVLPNQTPRDGMLKPLRIETVGESATIKIPDHSWVLLKVNDAVGELDDNSGSFRVTIDSSPR